MEKFVGWILLGLIAGLIGEEKGGCFVTIGLGIAGALVGGWIGENIGFLPSGQPVSWIPSLKSIVTATVGAMVVLALWKWLRK